MIELNGQINANSMSGSVSTNNISGTVGIVPAGANVGGQINTNNMSGAVNTNNVSGTANVVPAGSGVGMHGEEGGYYKPKVTQVDENTMNVSFIASNMGMPDVPDQKITLPAGKSGGAGKDGKDGASVTVQSVEESTADGGSNVVTFSDGTKLTVKNGDKGETGAPGYTPQKGVDYFDGKDGVMTFADLTEEQKESLKGKDGYTPVKGKDYFDGKDGTSVTVSSITESSADGGSNVVTFSDGKRLTVRNGRNGEDGYTPTKGKDYWTAADQAGIRSEVIASIFPVGCVYISFSSVYPGNLFGGTWEQIQNTVLPGAYMWKRVDGSGGEVDGGLVITDDGNGNVTIQAQGNALITDDGAGNVIIVNSGSTSITDDGAGNVTIF